MDLLDEAMARLCAVPAGDAGRREAALERAAALFTRRGVGRAVLQLGAVVVHDLWHRGWQPVDVVRAARRELAVRHARIAADLVAAEHREYPAARLPRRWTEQLAEASATVWWGEDDAYVEGVSAREKCEPAVLGRAVAELFELLSRLPEVPRLMPMPCETSNAGMAEAGGVDSSLLGKIRALLAKAESTSFPEEAEALTAKAQQLMSQHSIDTALLAAERGERQVPGGVRVAVDAPYEEPKAVLLQAVAGANRCRTVWSKNMGFSTVVGFASDVEAVELLFTSLLVQAQAALQAAGARKRGDGSSRTRSFRQSFLVAYATRIEERLGRVAEQTVKAAGKAGRTAALLPVLASRAEAVDDQVDELFGELSYSHGSAYANDREGWAHGTAAADQAELHTRAGALR
ncbi:DUF2786 domain-containing protein [Streptomyces sp. NPDC058572]|uniref:DUF2786 domain-containing protein n=1 Tax=Streptomyces sp. NPDC058572 TaxID=3346546 RepID=UPI00364FEA6C